MKAIVTVIGEDRVGIIASVCTLLAQNKVNVLDISQTILQGNFTMTMLVDVAACPLAFTELAAKLEQVGAELNVSVRIQREAIFNAMYRV